METQVNQVKKVWEKTFVDTWNECGEFEENEIKAWQSKNPLLTEARTCARVEAYVKLAEKLANKAVFMTEAYRINQLDTLYQRYKYETKDEIIADSLLNCYWHVKYAMDLVQIIQSWP